MERKRILMHIQLENIPIAPANGTERELATTDLIGLGTLMFDAYQGTIDYEGESPEEALRETEGTMAGKYGELIGPACLVQDEGGAIVSAVIFTWNGEERAPMLNYSMTRASHKGQGLAKRLILRGLHILKAMAYEDCYLVATEGNEPAISIYKKIGFRSRRIL